MKETQLEFSWSAGGPGPPSPRERDIGVSQSASQPIESFPPRPDANKTDHANLDATSFEELGVPPIPRPLPEAVAAGVFGFTEHGPIDPDEDEILAMTEEHARELISTLADQFAAEDGLRTGQDPRTNRIPRTTEARERLAEFLARESQRLKAAYGDALAAYAQGFGDEATAALDGWVRKHVAGASSAVGRYDPGHPWHYLPEGDNAPPIPVDEIEGASDAGCHFERDLPKNRAKRIERLREMSTRERDRLDEDRRRYQEIVEHGAEALSRYDREIAHTSDVMARATALSLKFNHIRYGIARAAWIEAELRRMGASDSLIHGNASMPEP